MSSIAICNQTQAKFATDEKTRKEYFAKSIELYENCEIYEDMKEAELLFNFATCLTEASKCCAGNLCQHQILVFKRMSKSVAPIVATYLERAEKVFKIVTQIDKEHYRSISFAASDLISLSYYFVGTLLKAAYSLAQIQIELNKLDDAKNTVRNAEQIQKKLGDLDFSIRDNLLARLEQADKDSEVCHQFLSLTI